MNMIVFKIQKKYWCITHKIGIKVPTLVKPVYEIDNNTGTEFWRMSISKEMLKVKVSYAEKEETSEQICSEEAKG